MKKFLLIPPFLLADILSNSNYRILLIKKFLWNSTIWWLEKLWKVFINFYSPRLILSATFFSSLFQSACNFVFSLLRHQFYFYFSLLWRFLITQTLRTLFSSYFLEFEVTLWKFLIVSAIRKVLPRQQNRETRWVVAEFRHLRFHSAQLPFSLLSCPSFGTFLIPRWKATNKRKLTDERKQKKLILKKGRARRWKKNVKVRVTKWNEIFKYCQNDIVQSS